MKNTPRARLRHLACGAVLLWCIAAAAQESPRYRLAESLPEAETVRYALIDAHAPPAPVNTVDLQVLGEDRLLDKPGAFVRVGLNAKLAQEGEEADRALVQKHLGDKTIELKEFQVSLVREYPKDSTFMNAGSMSGGLLGVLVGAVMDGMRNRGNARQVLLVRVLLHVDGKPMESTARSGYTEETLQKVLIDRADAAMSALAFQLRSEARAREEALNPPPSPPATPAAEPAGGLGIESPAPPAPPASGEAPPAAK